MSNLFIQVEMDASAAAVLSLVGICPVNIFAAEKGQVVVQVERQDECTLCELCLKAAPSNSIRIHKLYSGETHVRAAD